MRSYPGEQKKNGKGIELIEISKQGAVRIDGSVLNYTSRTLTHFRYAGSLHLLHAVFSLEDYHYYKGRCRCWVVRAVPGRATHLDYTTTLRQIFHVTVDPGVPSLVENDIGDKFFNVSFRPAKYDDENRAPVGNTYEVQYKPQGDDNWETVKPSG